MIDSKQLVIKKVVHESYIRCKSAEFLTIRKTPPPLNFRNPIPEIVNHNGFCRCASEVV